MRISVNLATRPFVELRPFLLRLRWTMGGLAVLAVAMMVTSHMLQKKLDAAQGQMNAIQARTDAAVAEKQSNERRMRQPANAAVLERSHFLNALFLRKSFSWTAVMMDLETVLPTGVQITSIEPQAGADNQVVIRMRVAGERERAVELVRNLEHSKRFLQPRLSSEAVRTKDLGPSGTGAANGAPPAVEFEILANYNPLPEGQVFVKAKSVKDASKTPTPMQGTSHPAGAGVTLKPMPPMQRTPATRPLTPRPGGNGGAL